MRTKGKVVAVCLAVAMSVSLCGAQISPTELQRSFRQPPTSARPHTWWHWVNGNVTREGITADLEALARAGIGGVQMFNVDVGVPNGPVKFFSRQWFDLFRHAVREAARLGLEFCAHNCAGWSSSGGPWVKPEHAMQMVVFSQVQVKGPAKFADKLPQPETRAGYYRDIAVLAFPTPKGNLRVENLRVKAAYERANDLVPAKGAPAPADVVVKISSVLDLTNRLQPDGRLDWDVPEGEWTILRIGHTPTGKDNHPAPEEGRGLEVDKMSREALDAFWQSAILPMLREVGPLAGKVFNNLLVDSYEVGCQNWTPKFREEFRKRRGYDLLPYLPVLAGYIVEGIEVSERFLWDYRRTIADLFAENYYGYFAELCHKHGLLFSTEPYGNGPFEDLVCGGRADIPMGEFWVGTNWGFETCKLAASVAHVYGKKFVGAEAFTATPEHGRWSTHPYMLKAVGDRAFCEGINRLIFHTTAHQPWQNVLPAMTMGPWGSHFGRTQTWWEHAKAWTDYLARCQYLLQQGTFVADILFFVGEHAPNSAPYRPDLKAKGYDYDSCPAEVLLKAKVRNGKVVLPGGTSYEVLVLPDTDAMTPQILRKIRELVSAGATVIGPKPTRSPSLQNFPQCDEEVQRLANEVWGNLDGKRVTERSFGKGKVFWGKTVEQVLAQKGVKPDFEFRGSDPTSLAWIHRRVGNLDIYFVANQRERWEAVECLFRVKGKLPELWHPDTGEVERAPAFWERGDRTSVMLRLPPYGSVFVVFRPTAMPADSVVAFQRDGTNPWLPERKPTKRLEIRRAIYGVLNDPNRCVDVTKQLQAMVREGQLVVQASNAIAGDPAPFVVKQLRVDYAVDGEERTVIVREGEVLEIPQGVGLLADFPADLRVDGKGRLELIAWQSGVYSVRTRFGKQRTVSVKSVPEPLSLDRDWEVRFPPNWGAPEVAKFERLISWSKHPDAGIRYFSGTATYVREFEVPKEWLGDGKVVLLDLGVVRHIAEVRLNGVSLGVKWKPPFRWDVTKFVKAGRNRVEVLVTNTWVNRLIGDEELPDDCEWNQNGSLRLFPQWFVEDKPRPSGRLTFTTWKHYRKGAPLEEAGLLGPVWVIVGERQRLTP